MFTKSKNVVLETYNMSLIRDERYLYQYTLPNKTLFSKYVLTNENEKI